MTSAVFVVPSVEKSPDCSRNWPINISHCTFLTKEYFFSAGLTIYMIWFEGCVNDRGELLSWGYSTRQERDADYDRILKAFPAVSHEEYDRKRILKAFAASGFKESDRERIIEVLADTTETQQVHSPAEHDPWFEAVRSHLGRRRITKALPVQIPELLEAIGVPAERQSNKAAKRVRQIAEGLGWTYSRRRIENERIQGLWPAVHTNPVEQIDMSSYCTSREHAIDAAKFIIRMRRQRF